MTKNRLVSDTGHNFRKFRCLSAVWLLAAITAFMFHASRSASALEGKLVAHHTPRYVATAKNLGPADPATMIEVSIWLQMHNQSEFDALTESLYDRNSPNYRHWLTPNEIAAKFGPTAEEAAAVRQFFINNNLTMVKTGPDNFYVRARGTVADVQKAFHVQLNRFQVRDKIVRANLQDPYVEGPAANLVKAVSGLDTGSFEHPIIIRQSTASIPATATTAVGAASAVSAETFSSVCFKGTESETLSENADEEFPIGTYSGNKLNLVNQTGPGCGYTPPVIQAAYNLTGLYKEHDQFDGTGQTIAIIDWCGTPTILNDVNAFSAYFGLPQLNPANQQPLLSIIYTATSVCENWDQPEINLDVEWAHAVAPGANITLVVPPTAQFQDVNQAEFDILNRGLSTVISGSYSSIESSTSEAELNLENALSEIAASEGISTNFSTGDYGDNSTQVGTPTVNAPADSPWATAVGGVSLELNTDHSIAWEAGWGTDWTVLAVNGNVWDPPSVFGFLYGSGGGESNCAVQNPENLNCLGGFPKPSYQKNLPGKYRQLPDISWLADPTTGAAILISVPGVEPPQVWQVIGGTSLSTPMFSGLWAIANQEAQAGGMPPLGQAAPYLYAMPADTIRDVVPITSAHNVTASLKEATGTNHYTANRVLGGAAGTDFISGIWDDPYQAFTVVVYSFGTDCNTAVPSVLTFGTMCTSPEALTTKKGWDNVTGLGTPNAKAFADYFFGK
jgi:subtilase family serine protease